MQSLNLLESLRVSIREISDRASAQERDFASRTSKLRSQFDQAVNAERNDITTRIEAVESNASARRDKAKST